VLAVCLVFLVAAGAVCGGLSYGVAYLAGAPSILAYLGGGTAAFFLFCLACPVGSGLGWFFQPANSHAVTRSLVALLVAFVVPFIEAPALLVVAALAAIAGGVLFHFCEAWIAALLIATAFPLAGAVAGALAVGVTTGDGSGSSDGGDGDGGGSD
jgi:hypothetical protein